MHFIPSSRFLAEIVCFCCCVHGGFTISAHVAKDLVIPWQPREKGYCPSFCDSMGYRYESRYCHDGKAPYCCDFWDILNCCSNVSYAITDEILDEHNCMHEDGVGFFSKYGKIILAVCLPLAALSVIVSVTLCSIQTARARRRRREEDMSRCSSARSSWSGTSSITGPDMTPVVVRRSGQQEERGVFIVHPQQPPPYSCISEKPPEYSEIFPS